MMAFEIAAVMTAEVVSLMEDAHLVMMMMW